MARMRSPQNPAELETALLERPEDRIPLLAAALQGPGRKAIEGALRDDPALRSQLRSALGDIEGLARAPWLVQFAARLELREALPELLAVARADVGTRSEQAAHGLLALGDRASLEGLAADVERRTGLLQRLCVRALFALGPDFAWNRLAKDVAVGGGTASGTLWELASRPELVAKLPGLPSANARSVARLDELESLLAGCRPGCARSTSASTGSTSPGRSPATAPCSTTRASS